MRLASIHLAAALCLAVMLLSSAGEAALRVTHSPGSKTLIDLSADNEPASDVLRSLEPYLSRPLVLDFARGDLLTISRHRVRADAALKAVVAAAGLVVAIERGRYLVRDGREPVVSLDVKDVRLREVLKALKEQCGLRNLVIGPGVGDPAGGTFLFDHLACSSALQTVAQVFQLRIEGEPNGVLTVMAKR